MNITRSDAENEIKTWLKSVLKKKFSVNILGKSESGDGYMGDIIFVSANENSDNGSIQKLDLVLKCSKNSQALRETTPVEKAFLNEIVIYEKIMPRFIQFQREKGVTDAFRSIPKCYGTFTGENKEVIILENLKTLGYELWPKREPLTREHIDLVISEYSKFHATSLALEEENPDEIQEFGNLLGNVFDDFRKKGDMNDLFQAAVDESYELLKNDLDEKALSKWLDLKPKIDFIFGDMTVHHTGMKVILHGDCWNNNFMFLHDKENKKTPLKVAFLDWQITRYASPILDLSYFLFACVSPEDIHELDDILNRYHSGFINHLGQLGVKNPENLYPHNQFLDEWKNFCKYGVMLAGLLMKIVSTDKDEVLDVAKMVDSGKRFIDTFTNEIRDKTNYKARIRPIVEYAVEHNLI